MGEPSSAVAQRRNTESFNDTDHSDSSSFTAPTSPSTIDDVLTALDYGHLLAAPPCSIPLFRGNAIFDIPAPPALLANASFGDHETQERTEFSHVRYSALTCKPTDFMRSGYTLRPELYASPRATGILISMIVRGDRVNSVLRSLDSVRNAVRVLCSRKEAPWGPGSWKNVLLVVVCDGEQRPETKALFAALGLWTDGVLASRVRGKQVRGHLFEYTTRLRVSRAREPALRIKRSSVPLQTVLCVFDQVSTIEAQQWIVAGLGEILAPRVWIPVKVGDGPPLEFFYNAWRTEFEVDRGRSYRHNAEGNQDALAEIQYPVSGSADFVVDEQPADERYMEYVTRLDKYMRAQHAPADISSSGAPRHSSVRERTRNFCRSLTNH